MPRSNVILMLTLAALVAPAFAQEPNPGRPGTLNYVEGQASFEGRQLTKRSVGHTEMKTGQYLATGNGKAEILLTPGVFLRLGQDSTVKMISPDLTRTELELTQGRASVEVNQIYPQNKILIDMKNGQTQLLKNGLYDFDAGNETVRTFDGKALVFTSVTPQPGEKPVTLKGGKELTLTGSVAKPVSFDKKNAKTNDPLYSWSSLRSAYLGEQNLSLASSYAGRGDYASGWYWNPDFYSYTWMPGGNGLFWSPFGYSFYSPYYLYGGGPIFGYGYGWGGYGYGGYPYRGGYPAGGGPGHGNRPPGGAYHGNGGLRGNNGYVGGGGGAMRGGGGGAFRGGGGGGASHGGGGHR